MARKIEYLIVDVDLNDFVTFTSSEADWDRIEKPFWDYLIELGEGGYELETTTQIFHDTEIEPMLGSYIHHIFSRPLN